MLTLHEVTIDMEGDETALIFLLQPRENNEKYS